LNRALAVGLLLVGCGDGGVQARSGLEALLQVADAQYFHGAFPATAGGGPTILGLRVVSQTMRVGQTERALGGSASSDSVSVALQLDGDPGYWVRPVGGADPVLADSLAFDANLGFSRFITAGPHDLVVAASTASGTWGEAARLRFTFVDLNAPSTPQLQVRLRWDVDADLDLHVVQPDGFEIWSRKISTYEPPVVGIIDQNAANAAGHLDFDSNAACHLDGRREENVLYGSPPPPGGYTVRVDTFSMCGQSAAHWTLDVLSQGQLLTSVSGTSLPSATRFPHELGAGVLATTFTLP
jgi:hypothetical protein